MTRRLLGDPGRIGALLIAGVGAVAACAMAASVGTADPAGDGADEVTVPVVAATRAVVCPGPEAAVRAGGEDSAPVGAPVTLRAAGVAGGLVPAAELNLAESNRAEAASAGGPLIAVPPAGSTIRQSSQAADGDLRGAVSTTCVPAAREHWLVGGSSAPGRRTRLLLTNPAPAPTTVDVRVLGPEGPIESTLGQGVVVPAGGQIALPLDAAAPEVERLTVHVRADGPGVAAILFDSWLRGTVPGGVDDVSASPPPAPVQTVPGLLVADAAGPQGQVASTVRIAVPGDRAAQVRVDLYGTDGPAEPAGGAEVLIPAGAVANVPLAGLAAGPWTAVVTADVEVVAGGMILAGGDGPGPSDVAWQPAVGPLLSDAPDPAVLPVGAPAVPGGWSVLLGAPGPAGTAVLTGYDAGGTITGTRTVDVAAGTTTSVSTTDGGLGAAVATVTLERSTGELVAAALAVGKDADGPWATAAGIGSGPVGGTSAAVRTGRPPGSVRLP